MQAFDWTECRTNLTTQREEKIASERAVRVLTIDWLHQHNSIGWCYCEKWRSWGVAFPIADLDGNVWRAHCRNPKRKGDGKWEWAYVPERDPLERPIPALVWGQLASAHTAHVFESQWDAIALIDKLDLTEEIDAGELCVIATRGAQSSNRLSVLPWPPTINVYLWPQNDAAGQQWLVKNLAQLQGAYVVKADKLHKDLNAWVKDGNAMPVDLESAMQYAIFQKGGPSSNGQTDTEPEEPDPFANGEQPPEQDYTDDELKELTKKTNEYYKFDDQDFPQPMGSEAFYGIAGEIVKIIEPEAESAQEAILSQFLVAFGNVIGRGPHKIQSACHHLNEFCVLAGVTSFGRKGTAWYAIENLLGCLSQSWLAERIRDGFPSGESIIHAVRDARTIKMKKGEIEDPGVTDKRLLIVEEEFSQFLTTAARPGNTLSSMTRKAWDAKMYLHNEGKTSPEKATGAHISLIGHITRSELLKVIQQIENQNGFSNRILWIATYRRSIIPEPKPINWKEDHWHIVQRLIAIVDTFGSRERTELQWSRAGSAAWGEFYRSSQNKGAGILGSIMARAVAHVLRLTMIYTILDNSTSMEPKHLQAAISFWQYCVRSARWIFRENTGNKIADRIYWELRRRPEGLTREQIMSDVCSRNYTKTVIDQALSELSNADLAYVVLERTGNAKKPAQRWLKKEG
jgi:Protein of unknown function (DUF3987)